MEKRNTEIMIAEALIAIAVKGGTYITVLLITFLITAPHISKTTQISLSLSIGLFFISLFLTLCYILLKAEHDALKEEQINWSGNTYPLGNPLEKSSYVLFTLAIISCVFGLSTYIAAMIVPPSSP